MAEAEAEAAGTLAKYASFLEVTFFLGGCLMVEESLIKIDYYRVVGLSSNSELSNSDWT